MSSDSFYHAFERNFRGSRDEISGRLRSAYAPFLHAVQRFDTGKRVLDLGCGRGEWLELTQEFGFDAHGVDLDEGMLADSVAAGLSVTHGDALIYLAELPPESIAIVSGFHIAEHLPFEALQTLFDEAYRVLVPGGLLILETPNAENVLVGTLTFHMDPTHNKPLPPGFMSFLARHYGFERAEILRLQEQSTLRNGGQAGLLDVLSGVSPDYALVAQKPGPADMISALAPAFARDTGLTLETLSRRFEDQMEQRSVAGAMSALRNELADHLALQRENQRRFDEQTELLQQRMDEQFEQIQAIYASTSWRITKPLRTIGDVSRQAKAMMRRVLARLVGLALKMPGMRWLGRQVKRRFPSLAALLLRLAGLNAAAVQSMPALHQTLDERLLSPRAAHFHAQLTERVRTKS
jgi:O-antigen chain-terminating methyltransferase